MTGKRVYDLEPHEYERGDYGRWHDMWFCRAPGNDEEPRRFTGNLSNHEVVEHEDGTITVTPSILVSYTWAGVEHSWHGYLRNGEWSEC
jgi:hypothetical protein